MNEIRNRDDFAKSHSTARLYFFYVLDDVAELARDVATDIFSRPHLYSEKVDPQRAANQKFKYEFAAQLCLRSGTDENFPSKEQRTDLLGAIRFRSRSAAGPSEFEALKDDLARACVAYSERSVPESESMHTERIRQAHEALRAFLESANGDALEWSVGALTRFFEGCYNLLRLPKVASVFGVATLPDTWPYSANPAANALLAEIARHSANGVPHSVNSGVRHVITGERAARLQRLASLGAQAVAAVHDIPPGQDHKKLAGAWYKFAAASIPSDGVNSEVRGQGLDLAPKAPPRR